MSHHGVDVGLELLRLRGHGRSERESGRKGSREPGTAFREIEKKSERKYYYMMIDNNNNTIIIVIECGRKRSAENLTGFEGVDVIEKLLEGQA